MPPSGFSQKAINGLLEFVKSCYQTTLNKYKEEDLSELKILDGSIGFLEKTIQETVEKGLPLTISPQGVLGLTAFISENYRDLTKEINVGKKQEGYAMQAELEHISEHLEKFKIWFYYQIKAAMSFGSSSSQEDTCQPQS